MITDEEAEAAAKYLRDNAQAYGAAVARRVYLEEFRKSKKSLLMRDAEVAGHKTAALQEREAYASEDYRQLLDGLKLAVEEAERIRWMFVAAQTKIEIWRTEQANARVVDRAHI